MSTLTLIGAHRAVSSLLETRPNSWGVVRFKGLFDRLDQRNTDLSYEMLSLRSTGEIVARAEMGGRQEPDETSLPKYLVAEIDDLVVNPMWLIGGGIGVSGRPGAVSPDYRVFRSRGSLLPRFIHYLLRSQPYLDQYLLYTRAQTTFDRRVQQADLDNLPIPVPPLDEQRAIADYLDRETARIDTLIEEQQRLIEMLRERRHSVLAHALSGGGQRVPFVRCMTEQVDYRGATPRKTDDGVQLVTARNVKAGWIDYETSQEFVDPAEYAEIMHRGLPRIGDLLFTMEAPLGNVAIVDREDIALAQRVIKWSVDRSKAEPRFLMYSALGDDFQEQLVTRATGSTALGVKASKLPELRINLPSPEEQRSIITYLDEQTAKIDTLIAETDRFIQLARERRSALITAAVTGQIDVRKMV